jgi:hypothetical protein
VCYVRSHPHDLIRSSGSFFGGSNSSASIIGQVPTHCALQIEKLSYRQISAAPAWLALPSCATYACMQLHDAWSTAVPAPAPGPKSACVHAVETHRGNLTFQKRGEYGRFFMLLFLHKRACKTEEVHGVWEKHGNCCGLMSFCRCNYPHFHFLNHEPPPISTS